MNGNQLLKDKNAIIYGGSGAIGGAVARTVAREGAKVFIAGRTAAKLDAVARDIALPAELSKSLNSIRSTSRPSTNMRQPYRGRQELSTLH